MVVSRRIIIIVLILKASLKRQNHLILNLKQLIKKNVLSDIFKIYEVLNLSQAGRVCIFRSPPPPKSQYLALRAGEGFVMNASWFILNPVKLKKSEKLLQISVRLITLEKSIKLNLQIFKPL